MSESSPSLYLEESLYDSPTAEQVDSMRALYDRATQLPQAITAYGSDAHFSVPRAANTTEIGRIVNLLGGDESVREGLELLRLNDRGKGLARLAIEGSLDDKGHIPWPLTQFAFSRYPDPALSEERRSESTVFVGAGFMFPSGPSAISAEVQRPYVMPEDFQPEARSMIKFWDKIGLQNEWDELWYHPGVTYRIFFTKELAERHIRAIQTQVERLEYEA